MNPDVPPPDHADAKADLTKLQSVLRTSQRLLPPTYSRSCVFKGSLGMLGSFVALGFSIYRIQASELQYAMLARNHLTATGLVIMSSLERQLESSVSSTQVMTGREQLDLGRALAAWSNIEDLGLDFVVYAKLQGKPVFIHASAGVEVPSNPFEDPTTPWLTYAMTQRPVEVYFQEDGLEVHWVFWFWPSEGWPPYSSSFQLQVVLCCGLFLASMLSVYGIILRESVMQTIRASIESHISELTPRPGPHQVMPGVPGTDRRLEPDHRVVW